MLLALNTKNLEQAQTELKAQYPLCLVETVSVDFNNPSDVESAIKSIIEMHENIDVLVNSAGVLAAGNTDISLATLSELVNVNLLSTITACNLIAEKMKQQGYGEIYNLGSTAGLVPVPKIAAYSATKAAMVSYSQSLYQELLPFGVKVCCLCPSVVDTDMTNDGRIDNKLKIETQDLAKALSFVRSLSPGAAVNTLSIRCSVIDLE